MCIRDRFVEALQKKPYTEYLLDILLSGSMEERACVEMCIRDRPVPVHCLMDEYANISLPKDTFLSALATMRSRAIFCSIIVQNMAQLKAMYKDDWESLVGLCDEFLYLGGTEKETHKYVSELLGKETISTTSYNQSKGRSGSYSINHQQSGRDVPYLFVKSSVALNFT